VADGVDPNIPLCVHFMCWVHDHLKYDKFFMCSGCHNGGLVLLAVQCTVVTGLFMKLQ
jgi:hypothetical protein